MILIDCSDGNIGFIFNIAGALFKLIKYAIPVALIILAVIDVVKVVLNPDDKAKKDAGSKIAKRLIYAVIIFLVPSLIALIFKSLDGTAPSDYKGTNMTNYDGDGWRDCLKKIID